MAFFPQYLHPLFAKFVFVLHNMTLYHLLEEAYANILVTENNFKKAGLWIRIGKMQIWKKLKISVVPLIRNLALEFRFRIHSRSEVQS